MSFTIYVTRDLDQMSEVAAGVVADDARHRLETADSYVLGLATGNTPTGMYKHLAKACNAGVVDAGRIRTFNLDEYVGLPGANPQQRALHPESYSRFMVTELFALLSRPFRDSDVPWGTLVDQDELVRALQAHPEHVTLRGSDRGKAVVISPEADGVLGWIRDEVLAGYAARIAAAGGIDLHVVGVGGRGHVAFHEAGIPFDAGAVLLVRLDDDTVHNAVADGHFASVADSPHYAVTMGAEMVYRARRVLLLANGPRKTEPVTESVLGPVTADVPISYGQRYVEHGGDLVYVLDEEAGADLVARQAEVEKRGASLVDLRSQSATSVADLAFRRDPETGRLG